MTAQKKVVRYEVRGSKEPDFPWLDDIESLKQAVGIAKQYSTRNLDGSATDIVRRVEVFNGTVWKLGYSHRWRVFPDGQIELLISYNHPFPKKKVGLFQFRECMARNGVNGGRVKRPLAAEVQNVLMLCEHMGYDLASQLIKQAYAAERSSPDRPGKAAINSPDASSGSNQAGGCMSSSAKRWLAGSALLWAVLVCGQVASEWPDKTRPLGTMPELPSLQQYEEARNLGQARGSYFDYFAGKVATRNRIIGAKVAFEEAYPDRVQSVLAKGALLLIAPAALMLLLGRLVPFRRLLGYRALRPAIRT